MRFFYFRKFCIFLHLGGKKKKCFAKETKRKKGEEKKMQLVHPRPKVNYRRVIDALADSIAELNRTNRADCDIKDSARVAPAAPSAISMPGDFDVDAFVDELLRTLDQRAASGTDSGTGGVGDAAADAAAEHSASSQEFPFLAALSAASTIAGFALTTYELYNAYRRSRRGRRR